MESHIRRIGVATCGGDSPGVNACVRAVVRMALHQGWQIWGIREGYSGLMHGESVSLTSRSVSHIIGKGGTFLGSRRVPEFDEPVHQRQALRHLNELGLDALVVIGGDGSMRGAQALAEAGFAVVGVPATIENDVHGADMAIGVDTALNTALDAIDRIKDTASSHQQAFLVECMGKRSGYLALMTGLAGGAEMVCIPERPIEPEAIARGVADAYVRGKKHCIIMVAAGAQPNVQEIAAYLEQRPGETGFEIRMSMLGHIQRGGSPTAQDRALATRLGAAAVQALAQGERGVMVGLVDGELIKTPLSEVVATERAIDDCYFEMAHMLAR